ncbi:MAG: J domain-containing protein [Acidimicrobiales bacterium]
MPSATLYEILDVAPDADAEELRAAFRRLSKKVHPDAGGSDVLFGRVKDAYDVLSDPARRAEYDRSLSGLAAVPDEAAPVVAYAEGGGARAVSLVFTGALSYTNHGVPTSGSLNVKPPSGAIASVTGTLALAGALGGTATVAVAIARVFGVGVGIITVSDPVAQLETGAVVLSGSLARTAAGQVTGTASGISGVRPYSLRFIL